MANLIKSSKASYLALMKARVKIVNGIAGDKLLEDNGKVNEAILKEVNKKLEAKQIQKADELIKVFSYVKTMAKHIEADEFTSKANKLEA
jgi:3-methyladenine DNA glycosylase Tag